MSANGISTLTWKRDRQVAKLDLASTNRAASGRPDQYNLLLLPATYAPNDNDQANRIKNGSSVLGRPWLSPEYTESGLAIYYNPERELTGGGQIDDQSGVGNNGVLVGATLDLNNSYFSFDGANDYIRTPDMYGTAVANPDTFSVGVWVYPTDQGVVLSITDTTTPSTAYHFTAIELIGAVNPVPYFGIWNAGTQQDNGGALNYNQWYHIAQTYDGTTMKGYVDGTEVASVTSAYDSPLDSVSTNHYFLFGAADTTNMGNGSYYDGRMGEIRIYEDALTPTEVLNNYNSTKARYGH